MPLNSLRSFEAAARLGSFRAAAEELGVTPSAVSLQIRRLEEILTRPLFVRRHRSVVLSETGEQLAPTLSRLFSEMEELLSASIGPESSLLRVSAMPSFAHQWLAPRLGRFAARFPQYQVRIAGEDNLASFDHDEVDIGIRYGPGSYEGLYCELIAKVEAYPVCSPDFADRHKGEIAHPAALREAPLIEDEIARKASGLPTWRSWFEAAGVTSDSLPAGPRFESHHMALMAAMKGQGVALGLSPLVADDVAAGDLLRLFETAVPSNYSFWLVCKKGRANERKIAAFRTWMADEIRAN